MRRRRRWLLWMSPVLAVAIGWATLSLTARGPHAPVIHSGRALDFTPLADVNKPVQVDLRKFGIPWTYPKDRAQVDVTRYPDAAGVLSWTAEGIGVTPRWRFEGREFHLGRHGSLRSEQFEVVPFAPAPERRSAELFADSAWVRVTLPFDPSAPKPETIDQEIGAGPYKIRVKGSAPALAAPIFCSITTTGPSKRVLLTGQRSIYDGYFGAYVFDEQPWAHEGHGDAFQLPRGIRNVVHGYLYEVQEDMGPKVDALRELLNTKGHVYTKQGYVALRIGQRLVFDPNEKGMIPKDRKLKVVGLRAGRRYPFLIEVTHRVPPK